MAIQDKTNKRYGKLVAIKLDGKDEHGDQNGSASVIAGIQQPSLAAICLLQKSCGCSKKTPHNLEDLTGRRYGKLLVIKRNGPAQMARVAGQNGYAYVIAEKPQQFAPKSYFLKTPQVVDAHSEIIRKRQWQGCGDMPKSYWCGLLHGAKFRNISVNMTMEDAWALFQKQKGKCALTNMELCFKFKSKRLGYKEQTASLDRIDSKKGYDIDRCTMGSQTHSKNEE